MADRWHLAKNLTEHLNKVVSARWKQLTKAAGEDEMVREPVPVSARAGRPRQAPGQARYEQMLVLKEAGLPTGTIAKRLGVEPRTIQRWLALQHGPYAGSRKPRPEGARLVDAVSTGALGSGRAERHRSLGGVEGKGLHDTLAAVSIGAWRNGGSIRRNEQLQLPLGQFLAHPLKT